MALGPRKHVPLRLPADQDEQLEELATRQGLTKQGFVMGLVTQALREDSAEVSSRGKKVARDRQPAGRQGLGLISRVAAESAPVPNVSAAPAASTPVIVNVGGGSSRGELSVLAQYVSNAPESDYAARLKEALKILRTTCKDNFEYEDAARRLRDAVSELTAQKNNVSPLAGLWRDVKTMFET